MFGTVQNGNYARIKHRTKVRFLYRSLTNFFLSLTNFLIMSNKNEKVANVLETALQTASQRAAELQQKSETVAAARTEMLDWLKSENSPSSWFNKLRKNPIVLGAMIQKFVESDNYVNAALLNFAFVHGNFHALEAFLTSSEMERGQLTPMQFEKVLQRVVSSKLSPLAVMALRSEFGTAQKLPKGASVPIIVANWSDKLKSTYAGLE